MYVEFEVLIDTVWNETAKNVKARPIVGKVYISEILWPQLERFKTETVRAAMLAELAQGQPPMIRNVYERCHEAVHGHQPSLSPAGQYQNADAHLRDDGSWATPFDEARRGDREYAEKRLHTAGVVLFCGHARPHIFAECARYAGMTEDEFKAHAAGQRARGQGLRLIGVVDGERL